MASPKPRLLSKEEVAARKETLSTSSEELGNAPPGAFVYTCQNGPNAGCRYYAIKNVDERGNYTSRFVSWIDPPKVDLKTRVEQQEKEIQKLKKKLHEVKKVNRKNAKESSSQKLYESMEDDSSE